MFRAVYLVVPLLAIATTAGARSVLEAVKTGDVAAARALLAENADVNERAPDGTTALHWAVYHDEDTLVVDLLEAGAEVTAVNAHGATPMAEAATVGNVKVMEALLDAGADVGSPNAEGQTPLMVVARASNVAAARLLLDRGADPNTTEEAEGQTPLMWAAVQSEPAMVRELIARGAAVNVRSKHGEWQNRVTTEPRAKHLPAGGLTPLLYAAREGCLGCVRALLDAGADIDTTDPDGATPLLVALLNAHFELANLLIERGANINAPDSWGRRPLMAAAGLDVVDRDARSSLFRSEDNAIAAVKRLLGAGADANATDMRGRTASDGAASKGYTKLVELLAKHGTADANNKDPRAAP